MAKRTAVIDIGSNSVRLVIFEKTSRYAFHLLHEAKSRVRISENSYINGGNLQETPMERAIAALRDFLSIINSFSCKKLLCVATSAVRDAPNKEVFLSRTRQELGLNIKVIPGDKEAYYGGLSSANLLHATNAITIDIGGGSTEFAKIEDNRVTECYSLNLGTVRLKELFFDNNNIEEASAYIDKALQQLPFKHHETLIGIGGTFRALAQVIQNSCDYPIAKLHGYSFSHEKLNTLDKKILNAKSHDELRACGIKKERLDVIKPGVLILQRAIEALGSKELLTSGAGVREGVFLADLLRSSKGCFPHNFNPSIKYLMDKHLIDHRYANMLAKLCCKIFDALYAPYNIAYEHRNELSIAAKLCKIGTSLNFYANHNHGYYMIHQALEYGFTHKQIMLISTLVKYHKKKRPDIEHKEEFDALLPNAQTLDMLSFILTLSDKLLAHRPKMFNLSLSFSEGTLIINSTEKLYLAKEQITQLKYPEGLALEFI